MARSGPSEVAGRTRRGPAGGPKFQPSFSHRRRNSHPKSGTETSAHGDSGRFGRGRCIPRPCRDVEGAGGRLTRLERMLGHQQERWDDRFNRLDANLARREMERPSRTSSTKETTAREVIPAAPTGSLPELAMARIEARLTEFGKRLEEAAPGQPQGDPMIDQLRRDVERLGQQAEARARASREELQSVNMVLQEVLQTLTRLALSSRGAEPMQVPVPIPVFPQGQLPGLGQGAGMLPGPGQDPMPGQDASRAGPGQDNRSRGVRNHSDGRPNPRR